MTALIRSDFKRFFRDKLFLVLGILAVVFATVTPLLYVALVGTMGEMDPMTEEMLAGTISAKGQFFSSFSFSNNLGLIAPLLVGIVLYKDFSFGTVRNKIIGGHSRRSIFLSTFTVCATALFGIILAHAVLTLGISLLFFEYQAAPFVLADLWYLLESLLFEFLMYVFVAAFVSWLCMTMKNVGMMIVLYIAVVLGFTMIAGVLQIVIMALSMDGGAGRTVEILEFFQRINLFNSSTAIGLGDSYTAEDVWYYVLTPLVSTVLLLGWGLLKFNRKDLK